MACLVLKHEINALRALRKAWRGRMSNPPSEVLNNRQRSAERDLATVAGHCPALLIETGRGRFRGV